MKEKVIRGKTICYAESAREMRSMLSKNSTQLLAQTGSAVAICQSKRATMEEFVSNMPRVWEPQRKAYIFMEDFRVLVSHRSDNGRYSLVGGARKLCESFEETAYRELGEETGLELSDLLFLGMISGGDEMLNIYPDGNAAEGIDALYMAMVPRGTVARPNTETTEFLWLTPDEIQAKVKVGDWHPAQEKTVKCLLDSLLVLPEIFALQAKRRKTTW